MPETRFAHPPEIDLSFSNEEAEQPPEVYAEIEMAKLDSRRESLMARREIMSTLASIAGKNNDLETAKKNSAHAKELQRRINDLDAKRNKLKPTDQLGLFS